MLLVDDAEMKLKETEQKLIKGKEEGVSQLKNIRKQVLVQAEKEKMCLIEDAKRKLEETKQRLINEKEE